MVARLSIITWIFVSQNINISAFDQTCGKDELLKVGPIGTLYVYSKFSVPQICCGAASIDKSSVLTSATCFRNVPLNESDSWFFEIRKEEGTIFLNILVSEYHTNDEFDMTTKHGDFTIMKLAEDVDIPPLFISTVKPDTGHSFWIFDIGGTTTTFSIAPPLKEHIKIGTQIVQKAGRCAQFYKDHPPYANWTAKFDDEYLFCAQSDCVTVCDSEFGMPLVLWS